MKSYISRKFPLETRITDQNFDFRSEGGIIGPHYCQKLYSSSASFEWAASVDTNGTPQSMRTATPITAPTISSPLPIGTNPSPTHPSPLFLPSTTASRGCSPPGARATPARFLSKVFV